MRFENCGLGRNLGTHFVVQAAAVQLTSSGAAGRRAGGGRTSQVRWEGGDGNQCHPGDTLGGNPSGAAAWQG